MQQQQNHDTALLQKVYHSASIGERATRIIHEKSQGSGMSAKLDEFIHEYAAIKQEAAHQLSAHGEAPKEPGALENTVQWMGVQLGTLMDKTPSHMAGMLMQDSTKEMIKSIEDIKQNYNTDTNVRKLAGRLVRVENDSLDAMKTFLS